MGELHMYVLPLSTPEVSSMSLSQNPNWHSGKEMHSLHRSPVHPGWQLKYFKGRVKIHQGSIWTYRTHILALSWHMACAMDTSLSANSWIEPRWRWEYDKSCLSRLLLTLVTEHSRPSDLPIALESLFTASIDTSRQADTLGAVRATPANLADALVGTGAISLKVGICMNNSTLLSDTLPDERCIPGHKWAQCTIRTPQTSREDIGVFHSLCICNGLCPN